MIVDGYQGALHSAIHSSLTDLRGSLEFLEEFVEKQSVYPKNVKNV